MHFNQGNIPEIDPPTRHAVWRTPYWEMTFEMSDGNFGYVRCHEWIKGSGLIWIVTWERTNVKRVDAVLFVPDVGVLTLCQAFTHPLVQI